MSARPQSKTLSIPTAQAFEPLLQPSRYKGAYGGRGSGKSYFYADNALERALRYPGSRGVCIREVQKDLKDSAKRLIEDRIEHHELGANQGFRILRDRIETPGAGIIIFQGMQDHTAESIKSLEGFDWAWVEEAQTMSDRSLALLRPTIRKEGSEIWFSWNPRRKTDPVDILLRQGTPPTGAIVVRANWNDNPWFPSVLKQERLDCLNHEPDEYDHIWDGGYVTVTKGAYYAKQLALARAEGRIGHVASDGLLRYRLFVDIGGTGRQSDAFAIWVAQFVGQEIRVVNYYEAQGQEVAFHLGWLQDEGYTPANTDVWLPHDGATNDRVYSVSYESAFNDAGYTVEVVPNQGKGAAKKRIDETRRKFPQIYIDAERCSVHGGLEALGWYHEKMDAVRNIGLGPDHDWASHGADAFGLMCVVHSAPVSKRKKITYKGWG